MDNSCYVVAGLILASEEGVMAEGRAETEGLEIAAEKAMEPSFGNALLYFQSLAVFPLIVCAAMYGGWWIAGPILFIILVESLDGAFGEEERNMDPDRTSANQLHWYELSLWLWAILWPATLVFSLWQILVVGHLSVWEIVLMASVLVNVGQAVFIIGHELVHRQAAWERWFGEFLLASSSYPHYATEHIYVHHALACTPMDSGTAPKGVSFWQLLPGDLKDSLVKSWRFARNRLARRRLPVWHYTNPFWRYAIGVAVWYSLVYWMGGPWALLIFIALCFSAILSMKIINYVQHYGLQRVLLPSGRHEKVRPRHSWTASSRFTNWLFYNMERHADHHLEATRHYPLLQHYGEDESPKLPGSYLKMAGLAMFPRKWFRTMDPLVDRWRAKFYPQIEDWRTYESRAYAAYPGAFEAISEILGAAPLLAEWINHSPELLTNLQDREFTDLDLPDGFGPDPESERVARSGLVRLYWTREFGVSEMEEQITEVPFQGTREAVEIARHWSNDKTFQVGMHIMRGNLSPVEAGTALSNIAEASVSALLLAVQKVLSNRHVWQAGDGVAVVALGDLASREVVPGTELRLMIAHGSGSAPGAHHEVICRRFLDALHSLSRNHLLFTSAPGGGDDNAVHSLTDFTELYQAAGSVRELLDLARARCVFETGDPDIGERFAEARREILASDPTSQRMIAELRGITEGTADPGLSSIDDMRGGRRDVERAARFLQLTHANDTPDILVPDAVSIFRTAGAGGLISAEVAARLVEATEMWQNLRGILRLAMEDDLPVEAASAEAKDMIARSCGLDDFDELTAAIRETASRAAADIEEVMT
ncbi:MAG: fatty acid desaturase [Gammaproteobacteria bacterium]|nr:fatty acid desaturase [Gammaproteobacteria bacterium]